MKKVIIIQVIVFCLVLLPGCNNSDMDKNNLSVETPQLTDKVQTQRPQVTPDHSENITTELVTEAGNTSFEVSSTLSKDSTIIRKLDLSEEILSGETFECHNEIKMVLQNDEIYFIKTNILYKIGNNENIVPLEITELKSIINNDKSRYGLLYGIYSFDGEIYLFYIVNDYESLREYYLVRYEDNEVISNYIGKPIGCYNDKILVEIVNEKYEHIYGLFDVKQSEFTELNEMRKYADDYYLSGMSYATENYFIVELKNRTNYTGFSDDSKYIIIDANTYEEKGSIDFEEIDIVDASLFLCIDNAFYIFDEGHSCIKTYNAITGELKTNVQFSEKTKFIKYEPEENSIYLQAYNYAHKEDEYLNRGYHQGVDFCIDEDELETALQLYIKYDLENDEIKIINTVPTKEYLKDNDGDTCIKLFKDFKIGDYIFTYYNDLTSETHDYNIFSSKFKIGKEIDFSEWKKIQ